MERFIRNNTLLCVLAAIACGPLLAAVPVSGPVFYFLGAISAAILAAMAVVGDKAAATVALMAALLCVQAGRVNTPLRAAETGPAVISGTITQVEYDALGRARYDVVSSPNRYRVITDPFPSLVPGDHASWSGTVIEADDWNKRFNGIVTSAELLSHEQVFSVRRMAFGAKTAMSSAISASLPEPHAGLLSGIVLGMKSALPQDLQDDFRTAGLSHIVVLSGFNLSIAALAAAALVRSKRARALSGIAAAWSLAIIAGVGASVARAAIMVTAASYASLRRRISPPGRPLLLAAAAMLLYEPSAIEDPGFQLSFLATVGVLGIAPWIHEKIAFVSDRWGLREVIAASAGAYIAVMPVIIMLSGSVQPYALVANIAAVPFIPWLMYAGAAISLIGTVSAIGSGLGVIVYPVLGWVMWVGETVARLPGAESRLPYPLAAAVVAMVFLMMLIKKTGAVGRLFLRA